MRIGFDLGSESTGSRIRNDIAAASTALCAASFGSYVWLFARYFSTHPHTPRPELGLVHALNNHGSYVYLSDVEATGLALLAGAFLAGFAVTMAVVVKEAALSPPTARWLAVPRGSRGTREQRLVFVVPSPPSPSLAGSSSRCRIS